MTIDFRLDESGDLDVTTSPGDVSLVGGVDQARQRIQTRFQFLLGEFFADVREGFPWFDLFEKGTPLTRVSSMCRAALATCPDIVSVGRCEVARFDPTTRGIVISYTCTLTDGTTVSASGVPYILGGQ